MSRAKWKNGRIPKIGWDIVEFELRDGTKLAGIYQGVEDGEYCVSLDSERNLEHSIPVTDVIIGKKMFRG